MVRKTFVVGIFSCFFFSHIAIANAIEPPRYYPAVNTGSVMVPSPGEKPVPLKVRVQKGKDLNSTGGREVDINSASAEEIDAGLIGVGPAKARSIVEYREKNGRYKSIIELKNVKGIGDSILEKNKNWIKI